eukprot:CAMPEP_0180697076 /NCGR_PEP_ID=MMETSP1038_2-20121128/3310_1 /TAXON_ID=632150 /ORGANISM="Azadinium spinosum, Strain 3D9" /LENGTH=51 /DNA_ID=CAMNT_0022728579 /DNA_START=919 /DNA_END=1074 /DNA_ORIENTATION=-
MIGARREAHHIENCEEIPVLAMDIADDIELRTLGDFHRSHGRLLSQDVNDV